MKSLAASLLTLSFAWGAAAGGDAPADTPPETIPSCDLRVADRGGSVVLEGLAFAPAPLTGVYELAISQGGPAGHSNIRQSGEFEATPGAATSLGVVSLSGRGYAATLVVHWDDGSPDCTREAGTARAL